VVLYVLDRKGLLYSTYGYCSTYSTPRVLHYVLPLLTLSTTLFPYSHTTHTPLTAPSSPLLHYTTPSFSLSFFTYPTLIYSIPFDRNTIYLVSHPSSCIFPLHFPLHFPLPSSVFNLHIKILHVQHIAYGHFN
jgi:hypothetical protein